MDTNGFVPADRVAGRVIQPQAPTEAPCLFATSVQGAMPVHPAAAYAAYPWPASGGYMAAAPQAYQNFQVPGMSAQAGELHPGKNTPSLVLPWLANPLYAGPPLGSRGHGRDPSAEGRLPQHPPTQEFVYMRAEEAVRQGMAAGMRPRMSVVSSIAADPLGNLSGEWDSSPLEGLSPEPHARDDFDDAIGVAKACQADMSNTQFGREVATPARSDWRRRSCPRRRRDMAVQANRQSIDQHAMRRARADSASPPRRDAMSDGEDGHGRSRSAGAEHRTMAAAACSPIRPGPCRPRLVSIIRRNGVPDDEGEVETAPGSGGQKVVALPVEYPRLQRESAEATWQPPEGLGGRAAMAVVLSEAVSEELAALRQAWGVGCSAASADGARGKKPVEDAYYDCLKNIAKKAEHKCVMQALQTVEQPDATLPGSAPPGSGEAAALEERRAKLEAELAKADERLAALRDLDADVSRTSDGGADGCGAEELMRELGEIGVGPARDLESDAAFKGRAEQGLAKLGLIDLWLNGTLSKLGEIRDDLDRRERAASKRAFSHMPDREADPRSVLLKFA